MSEHKFLTFTPTTSVFIQFLRYCCVGGVAFIVDFTFLYILTDFFGIHYLSSAALSFLLGLIVNYHLSKMWVFDKTLIQNRFAEFGIFALIGLVGLLINELSIWFLTEKLHVYYLSSKVFTASIVLLWNFFLRKLVLFK